MSRTLRIGIASALYYALAFNIVFFVQELFLVLPKALTPGLHPVLFHNNHDWTGHHRLENLFQGTGALATILLGVVSLAALRARNRSTGARLFFAWLAYCGFFMALPQVVIGAFLSANDVGRAMDWFALAQPAKWALAGVAIVAMILLSRRIAPEFSRIGSILGVATLPAFAGTLLVLPFRVPGPPIEVAIVPLFVLLAGVPLMQLFGRAGSGYRIGPARPSLAAPALALVALLLIFQFGLRHGIAF